MVLKLQVLFLHYFLERQARFQSFEVEYGGELNTTFHSTGSDIETALVLSSAMILALCGLLLSARYLD
jgi:hypothetical protein